MPAKVHTAGKTCNAMYNVYACICIISPLHSQCQHEKRAANMERLIQNNTLENLF